MIKSVKTFFLMLRDSVLLLRRTEPLILSSSTAFFATFSLSPILLLLMAVFGLYFKSERISNQLFGKIGTTIGAEAAQEIESFVKNFMEIEAGWWMTAAGILFFLFVSTTLLGVIKVNIHKIWKIRKSITRYTHTLRERMMQVAIILITGGLFLISFMIDSSLAISLDYLQSTLPHVGIVAIQAINLIFSLIVITLWFTILFKMLPQAKVHWETAFNGAFLTAILYSIGKFGLSKVLIHSRIETIFGASASLALVLLFIFYCSFILYYGAAFTYVYADQSDKHICAGKYASEYEEKILENAPSRRDEAA
jgi:membrane protein